MRHLAKVEHKDFIRNSLSQHNRQVKLGFLEFLASDNTLPGNNLRILVRYLNTDGSLARYRGNDTDTVSRQAQRNIILQSANFGDTHALFGSYLIQSNRRTDRCLNRADFNAEAAQRIDDTVFIGILFIHINCRIVVFKMLHQVDRGETIILQIFCRVIRFHFRSLIFFFRSGRLHFKTGFFILRRLSPQRRNNIGNGWFEHHGYPFTLIG